jgi:hypothetical protein
MAPPDTTLEPRGLLDKSGKFSLDRTEITSLMTYVWTGVLLATTETEYQKRVVMTADRYNKVFIPVNCLLLYSLQLTLSLGRNWTLCSKITN